MNGYNNGNANIDKHFSLKLKKLIYWAPTEDQEWNKRLWHQVSNMLVIFNINP